MLKLKLLSHAGPIIWPLIGNALELAATDLKCPHLALAKLAKKYGNIVGFGFGPQYSVLLSGYEDMKKILKKPELCEFRFISPGVQDRSFNQNLGKHELLTSFSIQIFNTDTDNKVNTLFE